MKTIPDQFTQSGWNFRLVERTEKHLIFAKSFGNEKREHFEVFQRRITPAGRFVRDGVEIETGEKEAFPSDKDFGHWAYSALSLAHARLKATAIRPHKSVSGDSLG